MGNDELNDYCIPEGGGLGCSHVVTSETEMSHEIFLKLPLRVLAIYGHPSTGCRNHTLISVWENTPLPTLHPCGLVKAVPPGPVGGVWQPGTKPDSGVFLATGVGLEMDM